MKRILSQARWIGWNRKGAAGEGVLGYRVWAKSKCKSSCSRDWQMLDKMNDGFQEKPQHFNILLKQTNSGIAPIYSVWHKIS